jgi:basic membrane lipoprotein Med (substrate-binding protein (PBP1-ABC) superfamily)
VGFLAGRRLAVAVVAALALAVTVVAWLVWPSSEPKQPPRARQYVDYSACLLTDGSGLAGDGAGRAWSAMQAASTATSMKVFYVAAAGTTAAQEVRPFVAGLVQRRCNVIVAVGPHETDAVQAAASAYPGVVFVAVSDGALSGGVRRVPAGDGMEESLRSLLISAYGAASPR